LCATLCILDREPLVKCTGAQMTPPPMAKDLRDTRLSPDPPARLGVRVDAQTRAEPLPAWSWAANSFPCRLLFFIRGSI
jgi:hypothetical protein